MATHSLRKKCPKCRKVRKFTVPFDHMIIKGWTKRDNRWICRWCIARETLDGEEIMRKERKDHLLNKKRDNNHENKNLLH